MRFGIPCRREDDHFVVFDEVVVCHQGSPEGRCRGEVVVSLAWIHMLS
jgi:hypothetical protein